MTQNKIPTILELFGEGFIEPSDRRKAYLAADVEEKTKYLIKIHVKAALQAAYKKSYSSGYQGSENEILNVYPENLIK
jgi:hypothetical protein